ncbi:hypothetical protein FRC10_011984, partial [Ceratobasidium sp. 414]
LHNVVYPLNGIEENVSLISTLQNQRRLTDTVKDYLCAAIAELDSDDEPPASFLLTLVYGLSLTKLLDQQVLDCYAAEEHAFYLYNGFIQLNDSGQDDPCRDELLVMDLVDFFRAERADSLTGAIYALRYMLSSAIGTSGVDDDANTKDMDAAMLIHLAELITREIAFCLHAAESTTQDGFAGLLLPNSWARSMARTQNPPRNKRELDTNSLEVFLQVLARLSTALRFGARCRWTVDGASLYKKQEVLHTLNLRLCWCASLLFLNLSPSHTLAHLALRTLHGLSGNEKPPG